MMRMSLRQLRAYHKQIARLEADESLRRIRDASAPYMKPDEARDLQDELRRIAEARPERIIHGPEDLVTFLNRR